ncbi:curli-like amyloid fiber formation chaperone CsgH [Pelagovum pacificum]|uniref:CsgH-like domain-containing protein n=1 Tax=Pelagovum pacificum TaxID=2588711 RepID=A0A5C5GFP0_9RHOB|nr:curli-like amyloid fiber formation chaperone CsgH [Pelagovum pacificum]QQA43298.1 hypothetical protein I8N54_01630 [Pelagovum pacificum]TNY33565.1 hypothetical protein FHY64_09895 [Pelagovum pacificum]
MIATIRAIAAASAAVVAAACAVPAATGTETATAAPLRCGLQVTEAGGMVTVEGVVQSDTAVSGSYALNLTRSAGGGTAQVQQGGAFTLAAGESGRIGRAEFNGRAADIDGQLTVNVSGADLVCPMMP